MPILKSIRKATRRRLRILAWVTLTGLAIGVGYGSLIGFAGWGQALTGGMIGAVHGTIISSAIGLMEIFGVRTPLGRRIAKAPLILTILTKGVIYSSVILGVELFSVGELVVLGEVGDPLTTRAFAPMSIIFSFIIMLIIIFFMQISQLVGGGPMRNLLLGRYHRPRMERRFFLFVDLVGSTRIAEAIGPLGMHRFLNRVFALIADPVANHDGEIYQYVGDEIVITWQEAAGRIKARPLGCFFAIQDILADEAPWFERHFKITPAVRGALHAGPVVAGEVGVNRRSIVFHGDVLNVCARLEQATRGLNCAFLASEHAIERLDGVNGYSIIDRGPQNLRGRQSPIAVVEVA